MVLLTTLKALAIRSPAIVRGWINMLKNFRWKAFLIPWILLTAAAISCNLGSSGVEFGSSVQNLVLDYVPSFSADGGPAYELSPDQRERIQLSGYPDRFLILFYQETDSSQKDLPVRLETWFYDLAGLQIIFINGSQIQESPLDAAVDEGMGRTYYNPEMFSSWMTLDHITSAVAQTEFYRVPIQGDQGPAVELIYFQGLVVGLQNDRIMYLETLPIGEAGLAYQEWIPAVEPSEENGQPQNSQETGAPEAPENTLAPEGLQDTPDASSLTGNVIYTVNDGGNYEVYALNLDTDQDLNLSASPSEDVYAACSPESGAIYFVSDRSGVDQVYSINLDGTNPQQITNSPSSKEFLNWYSETELIYWQWGGDLENSYVIFNILDGSETPVEEDLGKAYSKSKGVSPGAEYIAVSEKRSEEDYEIWITNLYTNQETRITDNDTADTNPVFSPVDSLLIYSSQGDLWAYNWLDGTTTQVTQTSGWGEISHCWLE
jgi:hypothetical protein